MLGQDFETPYGNTGVVNTGAAGTACFSIDAGSLVSEFQPGEISVDWLEFTILAPFKVENVPAFLGLDEIGLSDQPTGAQGYRVRQNAGSVTILSDGSPGMGIHVVCTGSAIKDLQIDCLSILAKIAHLNSENYTVFTADFDPAEYKKLAEVYTHTAGIAAKRAQITRLDIALDDFAGCLPLPLFAQCLKAGQVSAKAKKYGIIEGGTITDGKVTARTYYLGKRQSNFMLRLYDKRQEQIDQGADPLELPEIWGRCEMELKADSANNAAAAILDAGQLNAPARAMLNNFMSVKIPTADSNKSRWPVASWWLQFVDTIEKLKLGKKLKKPTIESRRKWFDKQCNKTAAVLGVAFGNDYLLQTIEAGYLKLDEKEREEVDTFARKRRAEDNVNYEMLNAGYNENCPACRTNDTLKTDSKGGRFVCTFCGQLFQIAAPDKIAA